MALMATIAVPAAFADTVLYSTSFENPPFTTGPIAGQDGWNVFGPGISTVENSFADTGSQAVFVDGGTLVNPARTTATSPRGPWSMSPPISPSSPAARSRNGS